MYTATVLAVDLLALTSWFPALTGDLSVELPLRPAAHRADLLQAAAVEEATPEEEQQS